MAASTLIIGIQGSQGSFSEQACQLYCQDHGMKNFDVQHLYTTHKVLQYLSQGKVDFGVFAVVNNVSGVLLESIEAMGEFSFHVVDVFDMPVSYVLLAPRGTLRKQIRVILSHPAILDGCKKTLQTRYPRVKVDQGQGILVDQAATALYLARPGAPKHVAVIGQKICARLFGLEILDEQMEDAPSKTTFVWCRARSGPS